MPQLQTLLELIEAAQYCDSHERAVEIVRELKSIEDSMYEESGNSWSNVLSIEDWTKTIRAINDVVFELEESWGEVFA